LECPPLTGGPAPAADQTDRVHIQQKRGSTAIGSRLRIEHVSDAEGKLKLLALGRVLMEEVTEICGRGLSESNRE